MTMRFPSEGFPFASEPEFTPGELLDEVKAGARTQMNITSPEGGRKGPSRHSRRA